MSTATRKAEVAAAHSAKICSKKIVFEYTEVEGWPPHEQGGGDGCGGEP